MHSAEITVLLPTRNEARNVPAFLASLPSHVTLIVVDASEDATADLIYRLRPHNTHVIRQPSTVTQARHIGAAAARMSWLLFTDADIVFGDDYFVQLEDLPECDAVYGPKLSRDAYVDYYARIARGQAFWHRLGVPAVSGSNLLVRREALHAAGGFDLDLTVNEDSELGWRLKRRGYDIRFAPSLAVYARDHRRLRRGALTKTLHSLVRCTLLYFNLLPARWRKSDWGYWAARS